MCTLLHPLILSDRLVPRLLSQVVKTFLPRDQVHMFGFNYSHKGNHGSVRRRWMLDVRDLPP